MKTFEWSFSRLLLVGFSALVGLFLIGPTLIVVPLSFTSEQSFRFPPTGWSTRWYENFFSDPSWYESALLSLRIALVVAILASILGTMAAIALVNARGSWKGPARGLMLAPMIVPGVITAIGTYYVFLRLGLTQNFWGFVLAHTVLALPFVTIAVTSSLSGLDRSLVIAAWSLGANRWAAFRQITLPIIAPGVLTGTLFAFLTSFDEAMVSLFLVGPFARTLPIQIYQSITAELDPTIAAASTMLLASTAIFMMILGLVTFSKNRREEK